MLRVCEAPDRGPTTPSRPKALHVTRTERLGLDASSLLRLQTTVGNCAVNRLVSAPTVQRCGPRSDCKCGPMDKGGAEVEAPVEVEAETALQRLAVGTPTVQRAAKIVDARRLESDLLKDDDRLQKAFHNDPTLTAKDNATSIALMQQALDAAVRPMTKSRRAGKSGTLSWDGIWGSETRQWVKDFQKAKGIAPGGFEAGRRTLDELDQDATSRQGKKPAPTPPAPPPPAPVAVNVCGPKVDEQVKSTWAQIQSDYASLPLSNRANACRLLVQPVIIDHLKGGKVTLNADAFDTIGLFQGSMDWTRQPPYAGSCGKPGPTPADPNDPFDPAFEKGCSNSVQIGNECWLSGTPNYGTFGIMMRLCYDDIRMQILLGLAGVSRETIFGLAPTVALAGGYKAVKRDNVLDPTTWAAATWLGGPATQVGGGNRSECACTCPHPGPTGVFDYEWRGAHGSRGLP